MMLQVKLLERRSRGVVPTVYGNVVLARGRSVRIELQELLHEIQVLRAGRGTHVRIGVAQGVASRLVPTATIHLAAARPKSRFSVWTGTRTELVTMLENGDIEFAVAPLGGDHAETKLVEDFLFDDRPVIVAATGHPLARRKEIQPKDLTKYRWVLSTPKTPLRRMLDQIFMSDNVAPPAPVIECDSGLYVKSVLIEKDFIGFLPRDEFTIEEKAGLLTAIPFKTKVPARPIGILRRRSPSLSAASMLLVKEIKRVCQELGYVGEPRFAT
jgi:DNA-binding transcriptional LysR family regulator